MTKGLKDPNTVEAALKTWLNERFSIKEEL